MLISKKFFACCFSFGLLFFSFGKTFAYDDQTTHPALTDEIVDFYNLSASEKISPEQKEWIIQGSILEDTPPRWINHFYDPINKVGWSGEKAGSIPASVVNLLSGISLSLKSAVSAADWANDYSLQERYSRYGGNRTWKKALEYYADGNNEEAYKTLGHILHLLEDMSVPEHTRNDTHAHAVSGITGDPGSPYEDYAEQFTREKLHIADELQKENSAFISKTSLREYLISLAEYSNHYFFSKDTINDLKYQLPKIIRTDEKFGYGRDEKGKEFPLARVINIKENSYYIFEKNDTLILSSYSSRLFRQAVLHGAGVINLFRQQSADALVNKNYPVHLVKVDLSKITPPTISLFAEGTRIYNAAVSLPAKTADMAGNLFAQIISSSDKMNNFIIGLFSSPKINPVAPIISNTSNARELENSQPTSPSSSEKNPVSSLLSKTIDVISSDNNFQKVAEIPLNQSSEVKLPKVQSFQPSEVKLPIVETVCSFQSLQSPSHQGILINEVAWMGTTVSANDEWIELKNISGDKLDLTGWRLIDQGEQIKAVLSGILSANGFYLLERTNDDSVPNINGDLIYTGALSNDNEGLRLFDDNCNLIDEVLANPDWQAGNNAEKKTLERDVNGWGWHTSSQINGTPKTENTQVQLASSGGGGGGSSVSIGGVSNLLTSDVNKLEPDGTQSPEQPPAQNPVQEPALPQTPAVNHPVISEVLTGVPASSSDEFIELYNPSDNPVSLDGWYLKRKATPTSEEQNLIRKTSGQLNGKTIAPKGFLLIASNQYGGSKPADALYSQNSVFLVDNGDVLILYDNQDAVVDAVAYGEIERGQSWERKALQNGLCVSSQNQGEFLGNGCDTDNNSTDFEIRPIPNPQNSQSLPEPRSAPAAVQNLKTEYNSTTLSVVLNWDALSDSPGAASPPLYQIYAVNSPAVLLGETTSTSYIYTLKEIGRDYTFEVKTVDGEGLSSQPTALTLPVPSFFSNVSFFPDSRSNAPSSSAVVDLAWSQYPFIPYTGNGAGGWRTVLLYFNQDPLLTLPVLYAGFPYSQLSPDSPAYLAGQWGSNIKDGLNINAIPMLLSDSWVHPGLGGGIRNAVTSGNSFEDNHALFGIDPAQFQFNHPFANEDYVSVAFYSYVGGDVLTLTAVDKTRYHFQDKAPSQARPSNPGENLSVSFDNLRSRLSFGWSSSSDSDTNDSQITYQINVSTSSLRNDNEWRSVGSSLGFGFPVSAGPAYGLAVRARDDFGNVSDPVSADWSFPDDFVEYHLSNPVNSVNQYFIPEEDITVNSFTIYTDDFQTASGNPFTNICYLDLYKVEEDSDVLIVVNDLPNPRDGQSGAYAYRGGYCAGTLTFTYDSHPVLSAGEEYFWKFHFHVSDASSPAPFSHGFVKLWGSDLDNVSGLFGDPSVVNAKFEIKDENGEIVLSSP